MKVYRVFFWFIFAFTSLIFLSLCGDNTFYEENNIPAKNKTIKLDAFKEKINESSLKNGEDYYDILDEFDDLYKEKYCKVNDEKSFCYVRLINSNDYKKMLDIYLEEFVLNDINKKDISEKRINNKHYKRNEIKTPKGYYIIIFIDDVVVFNIYPTYDIDYIFLDSIGYYDINPQKQSEKELKIYIQIVTMFAILYIILEIFMHIFYPKKRKKRKKK